MKKNKKVFSLHRRFSLYNFASAIVPVVLAFMLTALILLTLASALSPAENLPSAVDRSPNLLNGYIYRFNMRLAERYLTKDPSGSDFQKLERVYSSLEKYGLAVCVRSDETVYYITDGKNEAIFDEVRKKYDEAENGFFFIGENKAEICDTFYTNAGEKIDFMLLSFENSPRRLTMPAFYKLTGSPFFLILILFILVAIFADVSIVRSLTKSIMKPLDNLSDAAKKIKNGKLDEPVDTDHGTVEINQLCENVDEMRKRLLVSIEDRKRYEENRRNTYSNISHDARTAITTIKGYTQGLMEGVANTPEKQNRYISAIYYSTLSLEKLTDALYETVNLESDSIRFRFKERNMYRIIMDWFNESRSALEARKINLNVKYYCEDMIICNIDTFQFERIIDNLFSNSLKYKKPESETVNISIIAKKSNDGMFELIYSDDGIGIKPEDNEKIFDRFYRADEARSNVRNGNGIGLTIVRQIVSRHSGTVKAEGDVGKGLKLIMKLPIVREEEFTAE